MKGTATPGPVSTAKIRKLDPGYTSECDTIDEEGWYRELRNFDDANIYQAWAYQAVISGRRNMSHVILRYGGDVVAVAQARITQLPIINAGVAYIRWGPLWRRAGREANANTFHQAIRALRNEFVCRRGLVLRLLPLLFADDSEAFAAILTEEGFSSLEKETPGRTILMDLSASLEDLREGMRPHWKRELKLAERHNLEVIEGSNDELFETFIEIYKEMVSRKKFVEPNDIDQFRLIQAQLPETLKMKIMLCRSAEGVCAGLICSAIGKSAIYLFGATSTIGMKSDGSYLLHWKLIDNLKQAGCAVYNLNGINPSANPGTYKFKDDLAGRHGRDVYFMGRFDSHAGGLGYSCLKYAEKVKATYRNLKSIPKSARGLKLRPKEAR